MDQMARSEGLPFIACKTMVKLLCRIYQSFRSFFKLQTTVFLETYRFVKLGATKGQNERIKWLDGWGYYYFLGL